jgi:hypothetical protein
MSLAETLVTAIAALAAKVDTFLVTLQAAKDAQAKAEADLAVAQAALADAQANAVSQATVDSVTSITAKFPTQ